MTRDPQEERGVGATAARGGGGAGTPAPDSEDAFAPGGASAPEGTSVPRGASAPEDTARTIAEAWQRERPGTPVDSIGIVTPIWQLAKLFGDDRRAVLSRAGVDTATLDLLSVLRRSGPPYTLNTREIGRRCLVTAGAVSQRLARAEREGLVTRRPAADRSRAVLVTLTEAGHDLVEATVDQVLHRDAELIGSLTPEQQAQLAGLLRVLLEDVQRRVGDHGLSQVGHV